MKIKPLNGRVVVKPVTETETKSGIVIPDTVEKERAERGEIVEVGEGRLLDNGTRAPMSVKAGDQVMFKKYSPDEIKVEGKEFLILEESDIIAVIEN